MIQQAVAQQAMVPQWGAGPPGLLGAKIAGPVQTGHSVDPVLPKINLPSAAYNPQPWLSQGASKAPGYTANHPNYQADRLRFQGRAYARDLPNKGPVRGVLCYKQPGKKKPIELGVSDL